jgi:hypothetical protein
MPSNKQLPETGLAPSGGDYIETRTSVYGVNFGGRESVFAVCVDMVKSSVGRKKLPRPTHKTQQAS